MKKTLKGIWIFVFCIFSTAIISSSLQTVIIYFYNIPKDSIGIGFLGNTFILRIAVSLIGIWVGSFVLGAILPAKNKNYECDCGKYDGTRYRGITCDECHTYVGKVSYKDKLYALLMSFPTILFGIFILVTGVVTKYSFSLDSYRFFLIPMLIIVTSPFVSYGGIITGKKQNSLLNYGIDINGVDFFGIKGYNGIGILPLFIDKIITVMMAGILHLTILDLSQGPFNDIGFLTVFTHFSGFINRVIMLAILYGLFYLASTSYDILIQDKKNGKNILFVIMTYVVFRILYTLIFYKQLF